MEHSEGPLIQGDGSPIAVGFAATAGALAADADVSRAVRAKLAPHHELFCDMLIRGVRRGDRTALRLYPQLVGLIGANADLTSVLLAQLGVQSLDAARRIMDLAREAHAEDHEGLYERSMRYVTQYRQRHGMSPLIEAREAEHAVVGEAEGHANGNGNGAGGGVPLVRRNGSGPPRIGG